MIQFEEVLVVDNKRVMQEIDYKKYIIKPLGGYFLIDIVVHSYIYFYDTYDFFLGFLLLSNIFCLIFFMIPYLILLFNYLMVSKNIKIFKVEDCYVYTCLSGKINFKLRDIDYVEKHCAATLYNGHFSCYYWDMFYYYKIFLNNGSIIIVPCVLKGRFLNEILNRHIQNRMVIFPFISKK